VPAGRRARSFIPRIMQVGAMACSADDVDAA